MNLTLELKGVSIYKMIFFKLEFKINNLFVKTNIKS